MRFGPDGFEKRGEAFVQPDVAPVFAGDEIAEPLVGEFVRDQVVFIGGIFGNEFGMRRESAVLVVALEFSMPPATK